MSSKHLNILFIVRKLDKLASSKKSVSSEYCRRFTSTFDLPAKKLEKRFFSLACLIIPRNPFASILNKNGVNESFCLNPFWALNS